VKVLFFGTPGIEEPWHGDVVRAVGDRHPVALLDHARSFAEQVAGVGVVVDQQGKATRPMIDAAAAAGVKLWHTLVTGLDNIEVDYFRSKGLPLAYAPGTFSAIALAEHAMFLMLCCVKNLWICQRNVRCQAFAQPVNEELAGKTLGLIGLGASGRELARRARGMGMRVLAVDPIAVAPEVCRELQVEYLGGPERKGELLAQADVVSIHVPLTPGTRHMIDRQAIAAMKPSAILINISRGGIVEETALLEALRNNRIKGAGLDVFASEPLDPAHPFLQMDNVVATPHHAGVTTGTSRRRAQAVAENVERIAKGEPPLYLAPRS